MLLRILLVFCTIATITGCGTDDECPGESRFGASTGSGYCGRGALKIYPSPSPSASSYAFGTQVNTATASTTLQVKNQGGLSASSMSSTLTTPFAYRGGTFPGTGGTCTGTIGAGQSCTIVVDFSPTSTAFATASTAFAQELKIYFSYPSLTTTSTDTLSSSISSSAASTLYGNSTFQLSGTGTRCLTGSTVASGSTPVTTGVSISGSSWIAQSFSLASTTTVHGIIVKMNKSSNLVSLSSVTVAIRADCSGTPCTTDLAEGSLTEASLVTTTSTEVGLGLNAGYSISASTTYWAVIRTNISGGTIDLTSDSTNNVYASGQQATSSDAGATWTANSADLYFRLISCP